MLNEVELCGQGTCYGEGTQAAYTWTARGWEIMYATDDGRPLGRSSAPGHPSLALLRLEHEAAMIEVAMAVLWELDVG